jgi:hypothetical protein
MRFWQRLHRGALGAFHAKQDTIYDEENLEWGSGSLQFPRRNCRLVPRPRRARVLLLLIDMMVVGLLLQIFEPLITLLHRNEELFGSRVALHTPVTPDSQHRITSLCEIPRILHQTTATETVPEKWIEPQQSCKEAYSDFEYKVIIIHTLWKVP